MIIVDTREQLPLWEESIGSIERRKLEEGDYTTTALLNKAHIERKSGADLYGSIIGNHIRFRNELIRAREKNIKLSVFVECSKESFIYKKFSYGSNLKTPPGVLRKIITTISNKYNITFTFCNNREELKELALLWFENETRKLN